MKNVLFFFVFLSSALAAQSPLIVKDIQFGYEDAFNYELPFDTLWTDGDDIFFLAEKDEQRQLFRSNGDSSNTVQLSQFTTNSNFSMPANFRAYNGKHYFSATVNENELWVTDGTVAGTKLVKPDSCIRPENLYVVNGKLVFTTNISGVRRNLWVSDGTDTGTVAIKQFQSSYAIYAPSNFIEHNGKLYFTALDTLEYLNIWVTDGTATGTQRILVKQNTDGVDFLVLQDQLFFTADVGLTGNRRLWTTFGTAATTRLVGDVNNGEGGANPTDFYEYDHKIYFTADHTGGRELWTTNSFSSGTHRVKDINTVGSAFGSFKVVWEKDGYFYFVASGNANDVELWRSNGTDTGTTLVKNIRSGEGSYPRDFFVFNNYLYFVASSGAPGYELWRTDGTAVGTTMVKDIFPGPASAFIGKWGNEYKLEKVWERDGYFFFNAISSSIQDTFDIELWKSDGTPQGTTMLKDIYEGIIGSEPGGYISIGDKLLFSATDSAHGRELWITDGSTAGTYMLKDIYIDTFAYGARSGFGLYSSSGPGGYMDLKKLAEKDGYIYFTANTYYEEGWPNAGNNVELWRTNGTDTGTTIIYDVDSIYKGSFPSNFIQHNEAIYFTATDTAHGKELWVIKEPNLQTVIFDKLQMKVNIYPNPASSKIHISAIKPIRSLAVYDIKGIMVNIPISSAYEIDISAVPAGMYMIVCIADDGAIGVEKVIKME